MTSDRRKSKILYNPPRLKGGNSGRPNMYNWSYNFVFTGEIKGLVDDSKQTKEHEPGK